MKQVRKKSDETKLKMSIAAKNRTAPRLGLFKKGHTGYSYWLGKKHSSEHREKQRNSLIGKKQSIASNEKRSGTLKKSGHKPPILLGERNPFWKGGVTKLSDSIRSCVKYKEWRNGVFNRDMFTCTCGKKGGDLEAHHIKPFSKILKENGISSIEEAIICNELWDITNGITLCIQCHKDTDTFGRKALN